MFQLVTVAPAIAQQADVIHQWSDSGQQRAVAVIAHAFHERGGTWIDEPAVGPQAQIALVMNRIAGGNPPAAMQWQLGAPTRELAQNDLLTNLDSLATLGDWAKNLPPILVKNAMYDGHFYAAPLDIAGTNWMFYNIKIFRELNLQPPKTWDEFFAMALKVKAAGYIPIAFGANAQQETWLFMTILAGLAGNQTYLAIASDHDATAAASAGVQATFEVMGKLRQFVDAGSPNRKWNDTLALVETNKAALQIVGDWAKAELAAANLTLDRDYGCALAPNTQDSYVMTVDAFAFPKSAKTDQMEAQHKLAGLVMEPAIQTRFTLLKGALPARLDADVSAFDHCSQLGHSVLAEGAAHQLPNFYLMFTPDSYGQITDLLGHYWSSPDMSAADATKQFATIVAGAGH
jgi:glucose/mannose transport system substrate-binding protein